MDAPSGHFRSRSGLYDFRVNADLNVILGCGLGGTSLINANVALPPERWVIEDQAWPDGLRNDLNDGLAEGFMLADAMLDAIPYQSRPDAPDLAKVSVLEEAGEALKHSGFRRPHINVSFREGVKRFHGKNGALEIAQHACQLCGDCVSGCNYGAKKSLLMNYLPDARAHGATMFTEVGVRRLDRRDGQWRVHYEMLNAGRERFGPPEMMVTADIVILAAGALGSTEILLRSQKEGLGEELTLSGQVGIGFSGNGDLLGLAYNTGSRANSIGAGRPRPTRGEAPGPCIAGTLSVPDPNMRDHNVVIEEGVIPGALAKVMPFLLGGAAFIYGSEMHAPIHTSLREEFRRLRKYLRGPYHGATQNTLVFLVMGHDGARGRMSLERDRLRIAWPGFGEQPNYLKAEEKLKQATGELLGVYLKNPFNPITVHPLGGCRMGNNAESGVVDHEGRVFARDAGTDVANGLYVCDGSIVPRSLGINPLLTIAALAERMSARMARSHNWTIDYA